MLPVAGPGPTDQVNLTDEESRFMPVPGGGFERCYNAQAAVAVGCLLVVVTDVVQAPNDKRQVEPMLGHIVAFADFADPALAARLARLRGLPALRGIRQQLHCMRRRCIASRRALMCRMMPIGGAASGCWVRRG